jgi:hypothetical protein
VTTSTQYLAAVITHKKTKTQTPFSIKVFDEQAERMLTEAGFRDFLVESFAGFALKELAMKPEESIVSVAQPNSEAHRKYQKILKGLPQDVIDGTTIDLTGPGYQRQ